MEEYQKILSGAIPTRIIIQSSSNGEKYYIDKTGRYIKTINHFPVSAGTFSPSYVNMANNRANLHTGGFTFEFWNTEQYDIWNNLYETLKGDKS